MIHDSIYSSAKTDWETPKHLFDTLNKEFNFTIDVCATEKNAKCNNFYDINIDGLKQQWSGVAWMNPPYGRGIDVWVKKAYDSVADCVTVCLLPVRSDTKWWHNYVMKSSEIRLVNKRLSFVGANNKAPFPSAIVIFNNLCCVPVLRGMSI